MKIFVWQSNIYGLENLKYKEKSFIIAANHRGRLDGIWIWYYVAKINISKPIDMRIITGEVFFRIPIIGWYLKQMRCFPVEKGRGVKILQPMLKSLKNNKIVTIFPEGKMQKHPNNRGDAKRGVAYLVWKSNSPIIPIYINYKKKWKYIPIWEMTFVVGKSKVYNVKSENELKKTSDQILESVYKLKSN